MITQIYAVHSVVSALRNSAQQLGEFQLHPIHVAATLVGDIFRTNEEGEQDSKPWHYDSRKHKNFMLELNDAFAHYYVSEKVRQALFGVCQSCTDKAEDLGTKKDVLLIAVARVRPTLQTMANALCRGPSSAVTFMEQRTALADDAFRTLATETKRFNAMTLIEAAMIGATERPVYIKGFKGVATRHLLNQKF